MAEKLDPKEIVTLEELALSNMREMTPKNRVIQKIGSGSEKIEKIGSGMSIDLLVLHGK